MFKLIGLEMKKNKISGYVRGACITTLIIIAFVMLVSFVGKSESDAAFSTMSEAVAVIDTMVRDTFIIFASVLISKLVIDEYKSKTIFLLFMYPINRKKLMASKLLIVCIFTFVAIVLSDIAVIGVFYLVNIFAEFVPNTLNIHMIYEFSRTILMNTLTAAGLSLIPLFFGMLKKSVPATIVSSIIMVSLIGSTTNGVSLYSIIVIPIALAALGVFIAYLAIRNIEHADIT